MKYLAILLIVFLLLVTGLFLVFFFLDFRLMRSEMAISSQTGTARSDEPVLANETVVLYLQGDPALVAAVKDSLALWLEFAPQFDDVVLITEPATTTATPVLVTDLTAFHYQWTPLFASAEGPVRAAFASDGEVSWTDLGEVNTVIEVSPVVRLSASFDIRDRSFGLISRVAYQRYLGEHIGQQVSESLLNALNNSAR